MSQIAEMIVGAAPPERAGSVSALMETASEFGGALGIAILGSIGTAIYRAELADSLPTGLPTGTADAARATLGGALAVGGHLHGQLGTGVVGAARTAFTSGMHTVAIVAAAVLAA